VSLTRVILVTVVAGVMVAPAAAQDRYLDPPEPIARILDQPLTPVATMSPGAQWLLLLNRPSLPPIAEVAAPDLRLAGVRLDPTTNGSSRGSAYTGYVLRAVNGDVERSVQTPPGARLGPVLWSARADRFAFTVTVDEGIELWVAETATGATRRLLGPRLNAVTGSPCDWVPGADQSTGPRRAPGGVCTLRSTSPLTARNT
jgi:hypothetical protein